MQEVEQLLAMGESEIFQSPKHLYSNKVNSTLKQIGIVFNKLVEKFSVNDLSRSIYFSKQEFVIDKVVNGNPRQTIYNDTPKDRLNAKSIEEFVSKFQLNKKIETIY